MAHFALCPRSDVSGAVPNLDKAMTTQTKQIPRSDSPLTLQQQENLGTKLAPQRRKRGRKVSKLIPPDVQITHLKRKTSAEDTTPSVQQSEIPIPDPRLKAHGKAITQTSPHHNEVSALINPATPQGLENVTKKATSNRKRRYKRKIRAENIVDDMTAQAQGVYLAPHLRKRNAASNIPVVKLGDDIGIGSPPTSIKSQQPTKASQVNAIVDEVVPEANTPPSPPTTAGEPLNPPGAFAGWDETVPEEQLAPPSLSRNPRWGRPPKGKKHVWPKKSEIPRGLSNGSQSDGGVVCNKSDSEGDPSYDVKKLMQWNGDWLPPPEEWAARKGFSPRHFGSNIEKWANEHSKLCTKLVDVDSPAFLGIEIAADEWLTKDLVPRYWIHESIDNDNPRTFWENLPHRAPAPLSDVDVMEDPPYWERWEDEDPEHCFMEALSVPEARIDKGNPDNELESPFAMLCATDRLAKILEIRATTKARRDARHSRPIRPITETMPKLPDRRLCPKANMYLRPVQPADVRDIMAIYNHYVTQTVHASEVDEQPAANILSRIDNIIKAGLPFLVAVAKRNQRKSAQGYVTETIIGYVHLEDYVDQSSMYRYTFELSLYVHPGYIRQGVGKCLLDRMMFLANTGYNAKGGYEWINEFEYLKNGKGRVVKTILTDLHYERGDEKNNEWAISYLGEFGFKKAGRFSQIGHKHGKVVDKIMFQLHTTEVIDPQSIPTVQG